jgi:HSP20 family molecular chaperone IbpA
MFTFNEVFSFGDEFYKTEKNIFTTENELIQVFSFPGLNKDNTSISIDDGYIYIDGKYEVFGEERKVIQKFKIVNTDNVEFSEIKAKFQDGLLFLTFPLKKKKEVKISIE